MATTTTSSTTSTSTGANSGPNDSYATTATLNFIVKLQNDLKAAQAVLSQKQTKLNNATNLQATLTTQVNTADSALTMAQQSLEEAENAQEQIVVLTNFFASRISITSRMVDTATVTAVKMYEATVFVGTQGLDRVEAILTTALDFNKANPKDITEQWTPTFITNIQTAAAKGQTALNSAVTATKSAFQTLATSLEIDSRTNYYYQQCVNYRNMINNLVERLTSEFNLLKIQADNLNQRLTEVQDQQTLLTAEVNSQSFIVAQLQAEYIAAQKGASYTGNNNSPSNN